LYNGSTGVFALYSGTYSMPRRWLLLLFIQTRGASLLYVFEVLTVVF